MYVGYMIEKPRSLVTVLLNISACQLDPTVLGCGLKVCTTLIYMYTYMYIGQWLSVAAWYSVAHS